MYSAQLTKERINEQRKGMSYEQLQSACGLGANAIRQMGDSGLASFSLAKIADELKCSVDYLLGRTNVPNSHELGISIGGNVENSNGNVAIGSHNNINSVPTTLSEQETTLLNIFKKLNSVQKSELIVVANDKFKEENDLKIMILALLSGQKEAVDIKFISERLGECEKMLQALYDDELINCPDFFDGVQFGFQDFTQITITDKGRKYIAG